MTERKFKVILMGDSCAGKTSLVTRYIKNEFFDDHFPTLGESVYKRAFEEGKEKMTLVILDTAGVEDYGGVAKVTIRDSSAVIFLSAFDNEDSLTNIDEKWWGIITDTISEGSFKPYFVANKSDLPEDEHEWEFQRLEELAQKHNGQAFRASAKSGEGVNDIFKAVADNIFAAMKDPNGVGSMIHQGSVLLNDDNDVDGCALPAPAKKKCC